MERLDAACARVTPRIMPGSDHLIPYHILTAGRCFVGMLGEDQVEMAAGDVIVFPQGHGHVLSSARGLRVGDDAIAGYPEHYPHAMAIGAGRSPSASFVCGLLGCDLRPFNPLLAALPRRLHMPAMSDGWLDGFTRRLTEEVRLGRAGANGVLTRLAELMFLDLLRRHLERLPAGQTGWLAGLRDEIVGRAPRWSALKAGIVLGLVWGAWHVVPLLQAQRAGMDHMARLRHDPVSHPSSSGSTTTPAEACSPPSCFMPRPT
jgi:hypothetical protein